ncbi:alkaline phosphatase [Brevibacillus ruminantium]|uniref:Alkaline phosphatase n=1 Tax=Brevibacillus ruminantium TaxID=2950604 RepID=A0ABY4WGP1_9BACL|nr:alkaline phosphatase [Brevibacillus ruminantium]USG66321.1 alkaline phosphatase [Brevibacillus ruminantium]
MKKTRKIAALAVLFGLTLSIPFQTNSTESLMLAKANAETKVAKSKNVILMIGDGMGPTQVTAARLYANKFYKQEKLELDNYLVGAATTFADPGVADGVFQSGIVTDSASAGTAFATGNKTYNAAISVSNADVSRPFASFIEAAHDQGLATGLVTTARITHATPAVFASHVRQRDNETAIASQYLTSGVDVLMGGGKSFFVTKEEKGKRTDKNIIEDFTAAGYKYVEDKKGLNAIKPTDGKVLGLFANSHVDYVIDRKESTPSLADMTKKSLEILSQNKKGFAIMVEGGRIDHAGHANDIHSNVEETLDFDAAVKVAMDFAKKDGNTTVIISADHETGGLSLSRDNIYEVNLEDFKMLNSSSEVIGAELNKETVKTKEDVKKILSAYTTFSFTDEELQQILDGDGSSYKREGALNAVVAKHAIIGWTGHGHSGVDVGIWAFGPAKESLRGLHDNTELATVAAQTIGVDLQKATKKLQDKYLYPVFKIDREGKVLFPAAEMYAAFGLKQNGDVFEKPSLSITVPKTGNTITVNGKPLQLSAPIDVDNNSVYLPLEAFEQAIGKKLSWDSLSERIVME